MKPLISIIIPVYNTEKYLKKSLESVVNQTYKNFEVIIIDDGSPDDSYQIITEFVQKDNRFLLVRQKNMGLSGARNTGIRKSKGSYILFLDSDDQLELNALEILLHEAICSKADIIIPDRYIEKIENENTHKIKYSFLDIDKTEQPIQFALNVLIAKGRAWRASSILYNNIIIKEKKINFLVGYTQEDIIFNLEFFSYSNKISFINLPTLNYLKRKGSITSSYDDKLIETFLFIDKEVNAFYLRNNIRSIESQKYRDSLLCRNTIVAISNLYAPNYLKKHDKKIKLIKILSNSRIRTACIRKNKVTPSFNSKLAEIYFVLMFFLCKNKIISLIPFFAKIGGNKMIKV